MANDTGAAAPPSAPRGLAGWMLRVLAECDRAEEAFDPEPVHDLRVALRRCRSMADSLGRVDLHRDWQRLKKTGTRLFRRLGDLRDAQVLATWVTRLGEPDDPLGLAMLERLAAREAELKERARGELERFDRKAWKRLARRLPRRAERIPEDGPVFESIAVERWEEATRLDDAARRLRSGIAWHRLRIGVKRFRYVAENFLPRRHAVWAADLKRVQDLLGEVHDLDLLRGELVRLRPAVETRALWHARIAAERAIRLDEYRQRAAGPRSLWKRWREDLPSGDRLLLASTERLAVWASFLDPDFRRTRHVSRIVQELADALAALEVDDVLSLGASRHILAAAALVRDVGRVRKEKGHHKASRTLVRDLAPLPGWTAEDLNLVALVARYHGGAEPRPSHRGFFELDELSRRQVSVLAGVLRLAGALAGGREATPLRIEAEFLEDVVQIWVEGWTENAESAARVAAAKHLLEKATGRTFLVRPRTRGPHLVALPRTRRGGAS